MSLRSSWLNFSSQRPRRLLCVPFLLGSSCAAPVLGAEALAPALTRPTLVWEAKSATGESLGRADRLQLSTSGRPEAAGRMSPTFFSGDTTYSTTLPEAVRDSSQFVHFIFSGTARPSPDEGTVLNFDGAWLGLIAKRDDSTDQGTAQVVVRDFDPKGALSWKPVGILFHLSPQQDAIIASPTLAIRFDHAAQSWSLYLKDVAMAENLPLLSDGPAPKLSVRAGLAGDQARLIDLQIGDRPLARENAPSAVQGRTTLAAEFAAGNPKVRAFRGSLEIPAQRPKSVQP